METAIITCIDDNVQKQFEYDFLKSLKEEGKYKGKTYLIYYGSDNQFVNRVKKRYNIEITELKRNKEIINQRQYDINNLIEKLPKEITHIMCVDGGDVWFQSSINKVFSLTKESFGYVEEDIKADEGFNIEICKKIDNRKIRKSFLKSYKNYRLINAGMIVGRREIIQSIIVKIIELDRIINQDFFGLDQSILNYIIRSNNKGINLPQKFNYCLITKNFAIRNKTLYDKKYGKVTIVHNSGFKRRIFPEGRKSIIFPKKYPKKLNGSFWGITAFFNPMNYKTRLRNYKLFRESLKKQGLNLLTVELAFDKKGFELKKDDADILIQLKSSSVLWQKERMFNIALKNLPGDCDKIAWLDADIIFLNDNWAAESCKLLESYKIVQPFSDCLKLPKNKYQVSIQEAEEYPFNPNDVEGAKKKSFGYIISTLGIFQIKKTYKEYGHSGLAWCARRELFEEIGFYDRHILGPNDTIMINAFFGNKYYSSRNVLNNKMKEDIDNWSKKIYKNVVGSVSFTPGTILHLWHGDQKNRFHGIVDIIVRDFNFDPKNDIKISENGTWTWNSNKIKLHNNVKNYFRIRNEDGKIMQGIRLYLLPPYWTVNLIRTENDKTIGEIGIFLKNYFPSLYYCLKSSLFFKIFFGDYSDEIKFWKAWLAGEFPEYKKEYYSRMNPEKKFIAPDLLKKFKDKKVNILDVGSGPITNLGYKYKDSEINIFPTDHLAKEYIKMMKINNIKPPVLPLMIKGESLDKVFQNNFFHISFANNSLDHSEDPLILIKNMINLTRVGGFLCFNHSYNEGENNNYSGLHKWNFYIKKNKPFLSNQDRTKEYNLNKIFSGCLDTIRLKYEKNYGEYKGFVNLVYIKKKDFL